MSYIPIGYKHDPLFIKVLNDPTNYANYWLFKGLLYTCNRVGQDVICLPNTLYHKRKIHEIIIDDAHRIVGHFGADKTLSYIWRWFWWPSIARDTVAFIDTCGNCQTNKTSNQRPQGLLHSLPILTRPWESIGINFMGPLPLSQGFDYIMIVICRMSSMVHLLATHTTVKATEVAELYFREIVRLHGLPESIVSD